MKVMTQYRNIKASQHVDTVIEEIIDALDKSIRVESAEVKVERVGNDHPPVRVSVFVETPGPDIEVQARDYTVPAALLKVRRALQKRVDTRLNAPRARSGRSPRPARPARRLKPSHH